MRRSGVSGLCHRPDEAVASNRVTRRLPVDRLVFLTATCPSLHILRSDAGPGQGTRLSANPATISRTYGDMSHFYVQMLSLSHRRRRCGAGFDRAVRRRAVRLSSAPRGSRVRPGARRAVRESPTPGGSRFGDVTWARIAPGGLARIELRWIVSRWARTARGEADCVALGSHCASRARPPWPGPRRSDSYRPTPSRSRLRFVVPGREDLRVKAGDAVLMAVSDGLRRDDGAENGGRCVSLTPRFRGRSPWNGAMTPFPG